MISYAQNFEDVMLARAFAGKTEGFYVDVGAMDPVDGSVTKYFYELGWSGINIEPDEEYYKRLVADRKRDCNLNVAAGERHGELPFYVADSQGLSTFSEEFRTHFEQTGTTFERRAVVVVPLKDLLASYRGKQIDFLKIDVEGWEDPVLRGGDWQTDRPVILLIESTKPYSHDLIHSSWEPILTRSAYMFAYFDGLNRYYLREESKELMNVFSMPPNLLDDFKRYADFRSYQADAEQKAKAADWWKQWAGRLAQERSELAGSITALSTEVQRLAKSNEALSVLYPAQLTGVTEGDIRVNISHAPGAVHTSADFTVTVTVWNGTIEHFASIGPWPIYLSYHWYEGSQNAPAIYEGRRTEIVPPLRRQTSSDYEVAVSAPAEQGKYTLRVCILQEFTKWFDELGDSCDVVVQPHHSGSDASQA